MNEIFLFLLPPLLAGFILVGIHGYFGLHILERGIIFVDLSLAQMAALGAVTAFVFGFDLHGGFAYLAAFSATLIGALFFTWSRRFSEWIPQEAIIGTVYALGSAIAILMLSKAPEGASHVQHMLIGDILTVSWETLLQMTILYTLIGVFHFIFIKQFTSLSRGNLPKQSAWDFLFYATFGAVVTSSVAVAGVLLVFSFLVIPASIARLWTRDFGKLLGGAWMIGLAANTLGIIISFWIDLPTGGTVIAVLGVIYLL